MAIKFLNTIDGSQQFNIEDSNTILKKGGGNSLRVQTNSGYVDVGPKNTGWSHFETDRANFYFSKTIYTGTGKLSSYSSNDFIFQTNGTERLRIKYSNGNVGIGTTNPAAKLQVDHGTGSEYVASFRNTNDNLQLKVGTTTGALLNIQGATINSNAPYNIALQADGGNVGIGTTSPTKKLHVKGELGIERSDATAVNTISSEGNFKFVAATGYALTFVSQGSEMVRFYNGNVGIGTTSPVSNYKLHVDGTGRPALFDSTNAVSTVKIANNSTGNGTYNGLDFVVNSTSNNNINSYGMPLTFGTSSTNGTNVTERMRIASDGNVGIGTTSPILFSSGWGKVLGVSATSNYATVQIAGGSGNGGEVDLGDASVRHAAIASLAGSHLGIYTNATNTGDSVTQRMIIKSDGNVGIGTNSPSAKLHVAGHFKVDSAYGVYANYLRSSQASNTRIHLNGTTSFTFGLHNANMYYDFGVTGGSSLLRIAGSGNVGIGTTSPTRLLSVEGTGYVRDDFAVTVTSPGTNLRKDSQIYLQSKGNQAGTVRSSQWYLQTESDSIYGNSGFSVSKNYDGGSTVEYLRITSAGNVGIGTTSPTQKLHIHGGSAHSYLHFSNTDTGTTDSDGVDIGINTSEEAIIWQRENNIIKFGTNATERMRISSDGKVGIGKTNPSTKLDINGAFRASAASTITTSGGATGLTINDSSNAILDLTGNSNTYRLLVLGANNRFEIRDGSDTRMSIISDGKVGIGTTTPNDKLEVNGGIGIRGATNYGIRLHAIDQGLEFKGITNTPKLVLEASTSTQRRLEMKVSSGGSSIGFGGTSNVGLSFYDTQASDAVRMRINSTGNVGIGTTSPQTKLDVAGTAPVIRLTDTRNMNVGDWDDVSLGKLQFYTSDTTSPGARTLAEIEAYSGVEAASGPAAELRFKTSTITDSSAQTRMIVDSNGRVGIGTTSPSSKLDVNGVITLNGDTEHTIRRLTTSNITSESTDVTEIKGRQIDLYAYDDVWLRAGSTDNIGFEAGSSTRMYIKSNGNVGIGTTSPSYTLDVNGRIRTSQDLYLDGAYVIKNISSHLYLDASSGNDIIFRPNNGSEKMRLDSDGNLGIGTASPSTKLHVEGSAFFNVYTSNGTSGGLFFRNGYVNSNKYNLSITTYDQGGSGTGSMDSLDINAYDGIAFNTGSNSRNERMRINSSGNVGIGTSSPDEKLHVSGNAKATNYYVKDDIIHDGDTNTSIQFDTDRIRLVAGGVTKFDTNDSVMQQSTADLRYLQLSGGTMTGRILCSNATNSTGLHVTSNTASSGGAVIRLSKSSADKQVYQEFAGDTLFLGVAANQTAAADIGTKSGVSLNFKTAYSTRMSITSTGSVGIGTTSPSYKLDVWSGKFRLSNSGTSQFLFNSTSSGSKEIVFQNNGTVVGYVWQTSSYIGVGKGSGSNSLFVGVSGSTEGKVGIGTTSPGQRLHVDGNIRVGDSNDVIYSNRFTTLSNANLHITANTGHDTLFTNGGSERMRIKSDGKVGIGTSSPSVDLHVAGAIDAGGKTTYTKIYSSLNTTGNAVAGLVSGSNGASAIFTFTMYGNTGAYQKIVYSCWNTSGTAWKVKKVIDEGTDLFDITVDTEAATRTFTFVTKSGTANYSPTVTVEHVGYSINTTYA